MALVLLEGRGGAVECAGAVAVVGSGNIIVDNLSDKRLCVGGVPPAIARRASRVMGVFESGQ
jgi:hypothetical protein